MLHIELLGGFHISADNQPLPGFHQPRLQSLLAYLLLHHDQPQSRRRIAFLFWPDSTEKQARTNLRKLLHALRRRLPNAERYIETTTTTVAWRNDAQFYADVHHFRANLNKAHRLNHQTRLPMLASAVDAYRGDLLPHLDEGWIEAQRSVLAKCFARALEWLVESYEADCSYQAALNVAQRLLTLDPLRESTYRTIIRLHLSQHNRAAALKTFLICSALLDSELGVPPSAETQLMQQHILQDRTPLVQQPSYVHVDAFLAR